MIYFKVAILFFGFVALGLIFFMLIYLQVRKQRRLKYRKWNLMAELLIRKAIFFEYDAGREVHLVPVTSRVQKSLSNSRFRRHLTNKIVNASKSLSGQAGQNLKALFTQLDLDKYVVQMISSYQWHVKAKGLQYIGIMDLKEHLSKVYRYTNNKHELVRVEAQSAVLKLFGFEGLRFLDVVSYQISGWQQIQLLQELSKFPSSNFVGVDKWLSSGNASVVIFALKLARIYHQFELYENIEACLHHPDPDVRLQAIYTLADVYSEGTSAKLLGLFKAEGTRNQIAIANVVRTIGDEADIPVLVQLLNNVNNEVKFNLARTLANISPLGARHLLSHPEANEYPLNQMIVQIKSELGL